MDTRSTRAKRWTPLTEISVRNFKAAREAEIPLGNVTILVGPNGSGKSSVLQAVHWAARAASYALPKNQKEMISFKRLDYIPSSEPLKTLHNGELKTGSKSEAVEVAFKHFTDTDEKIQTTVRIRAARNKGGITAYLEGGSAVPPYKQRFQFITAYIPGLAGLSERETILAQPTLRRQASSGDAGGVLRNILYNLSTDSSDDKNVGEGKVRLESLNRLKRRVHPNTSIDVSFNEREDFHISASITDVQFGSVRPLETESPRVCRRPIGSFHATLSSTSRCAWKFSSASAGGMFPMGPSSRRLLNQSTQPRVAISRSCMLRHGPWRWTSSVL